MAENKRRIDSYEAAGKPSENEPPRQDTYWSIGFRTGRSGYMIKYVLLPFMVFMLFVILPFFLYAPELFSSALFKAMSQHDRAVFFGKLPIALLVVSIPFTLSAAMMIVGQIRRFHDFNKPGWLVLLNAIPGVSLGVLVMLCAIPGTKGPNMFGEDPVERRKRLNQGG